MDNKITQFATFTDARLIEIVKNAKQFGYDDKTRNTALQILSQRGITEEDLRLTGNLNNSRYDYTKKLFGAFINNSRIAFISYLLFIVYFVLTFFRVIPVDPYGLFNLLFPLALFIVFMLFLTMSFLDHMNFYRSIDKQIGTADQVIYFVIGMPFYVFMYFFYKSQMKEEMLMID